MKLPWQSKTGDETTINHNLKISNSDRQFINYIRQSLAAIDRKIEAQKQQKKGRSLTPIARPTVKIIEKIERVYIPVNAPLEENSTNRLSVPKPPPLNPNNSLFSQQRSTIETLPTVIEQGTNHVLVGLLESGNSSVALFKINGVTQRVKIGQQIGRSGWILIGASNREAKISRHGKVRRLSTGEEI